MTWADRMTDAAPRRSAPVARIDHGALRANVDAMLVWSAVDYAVADLRHDAWGHGAVEVARTLESAGVDAFLVDERSLADVEASVIGVAAAGTGQATLDSASIFGLPGADGAGVMRLSGSVLVVKTLHAGDGVSYGYAYRAPADTRIALVAGGYAQGIVRGLGGGVSVRIGRERHPIVGRVAMDVCVVEIGEHRVERGDEVVFFGGGHEDPPLSDWSRQTGFTAAELVTAVGLRAQREHVR